VPESAQHTRARPAGPAEHQNTALTDSQAPVRPPGRDSPAGRPETPSRLTARGAALAMFSVFLAGTLTAGWLHITAVSGTSFVAGCVIAGLYTKRADLLQMVTVPPMIFLVAVVGATALTATGDKLISTAAGSLLLLSSVAPWLFVGVAAALAIALFRGLPGNIRELRDGLRGNLEPADPGDASPPS
jgi:hypothetical protein